MLFHPSSHLVQDHVGVPEAVLEERRSHHGHMRAGHHSCQVGESAPRLLNYPERDL